MQLAFVELLAVVVLTALWGMSCQDEGNAIARERTAGECADGRDNDGDEQIDCDDSECQNYVFCTLSNPGSDSDTDTDTDSDSDSDTDTNSDTGPELDTDSETESETEVVDDVMKIEGIVKLEGPSSKSSASGTLCMVVAAGCPLTGGAPQAYREAAFSLPNASFPNRQTEVGFTIETTTTYLSEGTQYWIAAFVQESGGECSLNGPSGGDAMTFSLVLGSPLIGCDSFTVSEGRDVSGLRVKMNFQNQMGFIPWLS